MNRVRLFVWPISQLADASRSSIRSARLGKDTRMAKKAAKKKGTKKKAAKKKRK
jgi:hypothetical protein